MAAVLVATASLAIGLTAVPRAGAVNYPLSGGLGDSSLSGAVAGVAVDSSSGDAFVGSLFSPKFEPGYLSKFDAAKSFGRTIGSGLIGGVAVDPGSHNVYGYEWALINPSQVFTFDADGNQLGVPFEVPGAGFAQIASDAAGNVYVPMAETIGRYDPDSPLTPATIDCSACPEPHSFSAPSSVAVDSSNGSIYVADSGNNRVVKLDPTGTSASVVHTGASRGVAVDPVSGDLFVGGDDGAGYRISAYDSSGVLLDEFGLGLIEPGTAAGQLAVNSATKEIYVSSAGPNGGPPAGLVWTFSPARPTARTTSPTAVTQTTASLTGTVNPNEYSVTGCHFEYGPTQSYGSTAPCTPAAPGSGPTAVAVSAKISGLAAAATYHFRLVAENVNGLSQGKGLAFTTPSAAALPDPVGPVATTTPPASLPAVGSTTDPAAYKACIAKARKAFKKAKRNAQTRDAKRAAAKKKNGAIAKCKARFL